MGSYRTKEDDVARISTSVYITNFHDSLSAKELFQACKQYEHVVDSFIPNKKSKIAKGLGSSGSLIPIGKKEGEGAKKSFVTIVPNVKASLSGKVGDGKSYRGILKGGRSVETEGKISEPSIVLGDECVMSTNIANALFGRVKEFASLANLKMALRNEGFMDIVIKYMGELWVMLEFKSVESMLKFNESVSVMSWFSQVTEATNDFKVAGRIAWVEVKGVLFRMWIENTFARIANKWGKLLDVDDQDETCFHSKRLCVHMKSGKSIREDFKVIHRCKTYWIRANETPGWVPEFTDNTDDEDANSIEEEDAAQKSGEIDDHSDGEKVPDNIFEDEELNDNESVSSLKYPSGFTPSIQNCDDVKPENKDEINDEYSECCENNNVKGSGNDSISSGHFKVSEVPRSGGSMIGLLEEVVKVGQVIGFKMEGCISNMEEIIGSHGVEEDYFVINRGYWRLTGKKVGKWNGDVIVMGDFNKVRFKSDRFGSQFNSYAAQRFNSFISDSGLVEVTLGGCHFTWCHKSATKMSKLDRFLVSKSVLSGCPNINAITFERFLSDHRPIIFKENRYDYGPTPFRFFHHWLDMDGFTDFVENTWKSSLRVGANALSILMSKLRILKKHIRTRNKSNMGCRKNDRIQLKKKLEDIESIIDSGLGDEELINSRLDTIHQLQKLDILESMEKAQKAKLNGRISDRLVSSVAKILTNRLAGVLGRKKKQTLLFKADFEKAYDSVRWDFLDDVLIKFGFGEKWRKWIHCCLHSLKGSIIINGSPTDEFQFGKGLKQGILRILESIRGKFFNGRVISCKKASWVQWNKVLAPKVNRGLGISSLFALNRGLLFKWVWRFLAHESTLWSRVIKAIHGDDGNIDGVLRKGVNTCWTNITNEIKALGKKGINLLSFMHKKLGNGHTTLLWEDGWCEGGKLKERFPRAYALENCKRVTVGDKLAHPCLSHSFRRVPRGGLEETQVEELSKLVQPVDLNLSQDK
uniref:Nucleotide-binding alpha-beta plait domain-containing protein n=1 Tax=Tanacetum cinerariifolium TaxID=118510 RepID=A0A699HQI6_TANCI|nr:nucleotide-binding alpha-beta plait domain-containing protein [Tanacetum cinerariifolium]